MNGFDFASACRKHAALSRIPIVAYTSTVSNDTVQTCRQVGIDDCIIKTDRPGLLEAVAKLLGSKKEMAA
jgi:CheY-like chemotaxis protein